MTYSTESSELWLAHRKHSMSLSWAVGIIAISLARRKLCEGQKLLTCAWLVEGTIASIGSGDVGTPKGLEQISVPTHF